MGKIQVEACKCERCGYVWWSKIEPLRCAKCKSPYWNKPRERNETAELENGKTRQRKAMDSDLRYRDRKVPFEDVQEHQGAAGIDADIPENFDPDQSEEEVEVEMCDYKEYDDQVGEWFGCRLPVHGPKVKHQRGEKA